MTKTWRILRRPLSSEATKYFLAFCVILDKENMKMPSLYTADDKDKANSFRDFYGGLCRLKQLNIIQKMTQIHSLNTMDGFFSRDIEKIGVKCQIAVKVV